MLAADRAPGATGDADPREGQPDVGRGGCQRVAGGPRAQREDVTPLLREPAEDGERRKLKPGGVCRRQALRPAYYKSSDLLLDPTTAKTLRRAISSAIPLTSDVTGTGPDLAFTQYGA